MFVLLFCFRYLGSTEQGHSSPRDTISMVNLRCVFRCFLGRKIKYKLRVCNFFYWVAFLCLIKNQIQNSGQAKIFFLSGLREIYRVLYHIDFCTMFSFLVLISHKLISMIFCFALFSFWERRRRRKNWTE